MKKLLLAVLALCCVLGVDAQLRNLKLLNLENPPMIVPLRLTGLTPNADGLYKMADINARFLQAIRAYDAIVDDPAM